VIAAIYARKSTEQVGVTDEAKSVTRQIANAHAYATRKGWTVDDRHIKYGAAATRLVTLGPSAEHCPAR
jgi:hypothetical protein